MILREKMLRKRAVQWAMLMDRPRSLEMEDYLILCDLGWIVGRAVDGRKVFERVGPGWGPVVKALLQVRGDVALTKRSDLGSLQEVRRVGSEAYQLLR